MAKRALLNFAAARAYLRAFTTNGLKTSWKAGKKRLAGDIVRQANTAEVKGLRSEARELKECVAELTLENRLLKKSMIGHGGDEE